MFKRRQGDAFKLLSIASFQRKLMQKFINNDDLRHCNRTLAKNIREVHDQQQVLN
jgi:hypothetical protein